ncbi:non-ribosomal peptide synthetase [Amycolatopsis pigmentata]|uniref:Amino acid adenylation domain-containing protein n=1 Tax=Amycolatopsis pigmentata TaxID=450801 RepID=A0ABW5G3A5_9PSEU
MLLAPAEVSNYLIQIVVEGTGVLDRDRVEDAVQRAAEACPGARLVLAGRRGLDWMDGGAPPRVRVLPGDGLDRETFADSGELFRPLGGKRGEDNNEVVILTGERPALVFRIHHAVMDGRGALMWIAEVFRALRGEPLREARSTVTDADLLRDLRPSSRSVRKPAGRPPLRAPEPERHGSFFLRRTVQGTHPALVAKVTVALTDAIGEDEVVYGVPVDLRRHRPEERSTGNLAFGTRLSVRRGMGWETVHEQMLRALDENDELVSMPSAGMLDLVRRLPAGVLLKMTKGRSQAAFVLTHLGKVDLPEFSCAGFTATTVYSLPVWGAHVAPTLTMVEVEGRTEFFLGGDAAPGLVERGRALLDAVERALANGGGPLHGRQTPDDGSTLAGLLTASLRENARSVAIRAGGAEVTYQELDARAADIAATLIAHGVGPGAVVSLLLPRSVDAIAAMVAVLRCGAAFLPLDVGHPAPRLRDLVMDAKSPVLVTDRSARRSGVLPSGCAEIIVDDIDADRHKAPDPERKEPLPGDLAYLVYTSGSTGRPKGVQISHRSAANYATWAVREFGLDRDSAFPLFTSLAFDLPMTAIFPVLLAGGRIVLGNEEDAVPVRIREMLRDGSINSIKLTPSHLRLVADLDVRPDGVRLLVVGGESFPASLAEKAQRMFGPGCRIVNHYGPTEATVGCVTHTYDADRDTGATVPIGRPVDNMSVHVLDERRAFVSPGEPGELFLSGVQLAMGYRNRPDLDRDAFVRLADGTRAYRTGDLVRLLPAGELEHLGRIDVQVKIRGHRIEPAEVEYALMTHHAVDEALVVARPSGDADRRILCAYVVTNADIEAAELVAYADSVLPSYLVPAAIVVTGELRHTRNGKIDLAALPDPFGNDALPGTEPQWRDENEAAVAVIWERILGISRTAFAPDSDFCRLGGDSVALLTMVKSVATEVAKIDDNAMLRNLAAIISKPTIENMATLARNPDRAGRTSYDRSTFH